MSVCVCVRVCVYVCASLSLSVYLSCLTLYKIAPLLHTPPFSLMPAELNPYFNPTQLTVS